MTTTLPPVHVGTAVPLTTTIRDSAGQPVTPTAVLMWAKNSDTRTAAVAIATTVVDSQVRGTFTPDRAGTWEIAVKVTAPVSVTAAAVLKVRELPPTP